MIGKKYKLYVFDFDGTLIDTREDIARAADVLIEKLKLPVPDAATRLSLIGGGAKSLVKRLTGLGDDEIEPYLQEFLTIYYDICADNTSLYDGAELLLRRLKDEGVYLAVVTMKARIPTHKIIQKHDLGMFDDVLSFDDMARRKPDPHSMLMLLEKYGLQLDDALMIGDTLTDINYAKAAGVDVVAVTYGYGVTEDLLAANPTYVLESLSDL